MEIHPYMTISGFQEQLNMTSKIINKCSFKDGGIWFDNSVSIVCGTFPPKREYFGRKGYIHYSSPKNKFWKHFDAIYGCNLYFNSTQVESEEQRIENAVNKISFSKKKSLGFVDIYTKISRVNHDSSSDDDITEPFETIFDTSIFDEILKSKVENIIFVYSRSYEQFILGVRRLFPRLVISTVREYGRDDITLRVEKIDLNGKILYLSYCPIHGNIRDVYRRPALKAIELDFS